MKKYIFFFAAAAALVACSKNEVTPAFSNENTEIAYNVAPKTKALTGTKSDFDHGNVFQSYAYFLTNGETWPTNAGVTYIDNATISYKEDASATGGKWAAATAYYWPKSENSSLTFYAWSKNTNKTTLAGDAKVTCTAKDGIEVANYDVVANKNVDLLVADVAANKKANEKTFAHEGVPTLFRHKLSYVVFTVKTAKDYTADGKIFALKNIEFENVNSKGTYNQNASTEVTDPQTSSKTVGAWTVADSKTSQTYFESENAVAFGNDAVTLESAARFEGNVKQKYYLPQKFTAVTSPTASTDFTIKVVYTITTNENNSESTEEVTRYIAINDGKVTLYDKWEINKKYIFNLTFSLDEILWDPAVEEWETVNTGDVTIQ